MIRRPDRHHRTDPFAVLTSVQGFRGIEPKKSILTLFSAFTMRFCRHPGGEPDWASRGQAMTPMTKVSVNIPSGQVKPTTDAILAELRRMVRMPPTPVPEKQLELLFQAACGDTGGS